MTGNLSEIVEGYGQSLDWLSNAHLTDTADTAGLEVLSCRDSLADHWEALTEDQKREVNSLDKKLKEKKRTLARELPVFEGKDPDRWWWTFYA